MNTILAGLAAGPESVDRSLYTDPAIFELEQRLIFERTWLFVAHESAFNEPGDYRTTTLAGQPVIAVMGNDRTVRVFYNSCRHKGTVIVEEAGGHCSVLRCPYHHWAYDLSGKLLNVPRPEAYGAGFRLEDYGLVEILQVERFAGVIFACLDPKAASLATFLGTAAPFLEEAALYSGEEMDVVGAYDYEYDGNWKLLMENTLDDYHAEYLHDYAFAQRAKIFEMNGTSGFQELERSSVELGIHGAYDQMDDPRTLVIQKERPHRVYVGIFPSFIALFQTIWDVTGIRVIQPLAVDKTIVANYCLVRRSATEEERRAVAERYHYSWGPGGRAGIDDILIFARVQRGLSAKAGGRILTNRGIDRPGPMGGPTEDHAVRAFWSGWRQYMLGEGGS